MATENILYLSILPIIHLNTPLTEETLTLYPSKEFATEFFPEEVDGYIYAFESRAKRYLVGGRVTGYTVIKEPNDAGDRIIVKVIQNVR